MRYPAIDPSLFVLNRKRFAEKLLPQSVAIFNANDEYPRNGDQFHHFRQQSDLFYLSGIIQEKSILIIAPDHPEPKNREILFIVQSNEQMEIWNGHKLTKEEARQISGIKNVQWISDFDLVLRDFMQLSENVYLNIFEYPKFISNVVSRDHRFARQLQEMFPVHQYRRAAPILTSLRMVKSPAEIDLIKKAIEITAKAFKRALNYVKPGITEFEIQAEMEHEFLINRANGSAYLPIIASGKNSCVLHYIENDEECKDGDLVLFDFGAEYANYSADVSRTIPVNGKFTPRQRQFYELVLRVQKEAISQMIPGNTFEKYNTFVNKLMEEEMIKAGLFTHEQVKNQDSGKPLFKQYFMHGTAHHLGLDVHDSSNRHQQFLPGMVLTCEPGIYLRDEGFGIRIENNILITESGPVDLTSGIPRESDEIETIMAKG